MAEFPLLSEQDLPEETSTVEVAAAPVPEGGSLFERLLGAPSEDSEPAVETGELADAIVPAETGRAEDVVADNDVVPDEAAKVAAAPEPKPKGLLGLLARAAPPKKDIVPSTDQAVELALMTSDENVSPKQAALPALPEDQTDPDPAPGTKHKSIFGINKAKPKAKVAAVSEIALGTVLPYGKVARICGVAKRDLGQQVAQYPEKRPQHRVYDSAAGSTAPRTFFVTGFEDGCARQFTASLAMFGSASMHEQLRYGLPSEVQPYSDTDKAYEKLKTRVCGVSRKKPCGAKVSKMEKNTVFLSIYERFGSNPRWINLLLHDGAVLAQDSKGD